MDVRLDQVAELGLVRRVEGFFSFLEGLDIYGLGRFGVGIS